MSAELEALFAKIASEDCKAIIALSKNARDIQHALVENLDVDRKHRILEKLHVVYPPQPALIEDIEEKSTPEDRLVFTFVGRAFFRKGGKEILDVFTSIESESRVRIELNIVSSMKLDPYATGETSEDIEEAEYCIRENRGWINHYRDLQNRKVLALMKRSHVGLLPTHADTFGYSVLEFQAAGCPVISTNIRALPEINNGQAGWLIDVPTDSLRRGIYDTKEQQRRTSDQIRSGLHRVVDHILSEQSQIQKKAEHSIHRIRSTHDPDAHSDKLQSIYRR